MSLILVLNHRYKGTVCTCCSFSGFFFFFFFGLLQWIMYGAQTYRRVSIKRRE
jgi:hypothetical protein